MRQPKSFFTIMSYMLMIVLFFSSQQALASPDSKKFPKLTGHVVDEVGILRAETKAEIAQFLTIHEQQTSNQIVIAIIESLDGESLEEYATALFRHWGLGQKKKNNGVLLLFAIQDRKMKIEVGYGLEGTLTDANCKMITGYVLKPAFKKKEYGMGLKQATQDIADMLGTEHQYDIFAKLPDNIQFPKYNGYINDSLNLVKPEVLDKINVFLGHLEKATGAKLTMASLQSLSGVHPEVYASALFRHWGLAKRDKNNLNNNGLILIVADTGPDEKNLVIIKTGIDLHHQLSEETRDGIVQSLTFRSDFDFEIQSAFQQIADKLDKQQKYPPLLEPTNLLPVLIIFVVLSLLCYIALTKTPEESIKRTLSFIFLLAALLSVVGASMMCFDGEPDYISESLPLYVTLIYMAMLGLATFFFFVGRWFYNFTTPGSGSVGGGGGSYSRDDRDYRDYSSGGGSSYSGGGGSSGGGGASDSW